MVGFTSAKARIYRTDGADTIALTRRDGSEPAVCTGFLCAKTSSTRLKLRNSQGRDAAKRAPGNPKRYASQSNIGKNGAFAQT
jgi:hypothetical protein